MTAATFWPWLLSAVGCTGVLLTGLKKRWAWCLLIANEINWTAFALATGQHGFLLAAAGYTAAFVAAWWLWGGERCSSCGEPGAGRRRRWGRA